MPLETRHIQHLQSVWEQVIRNGAIEGDPGDIRSTEKFGTQDPGGVYFERVGHHIIGRRYESTAHVLERLYPPWEERSRIETRGTEIAPDVYRLKNPYSKEEWIYDKQQDILVYKKNTPVLKKLADLLTPDHRTPAQKLRDALKDTLGGGGTWVYYASDDPRLTALVSIYMKKIMEDNNLPVEMWVNADDKRKIVDRHGVTRAERHVAAVRIPEGYYTQIKRELENMRRTLGIPSSAQYKDLVDTDYRKIGSFVVRGSKI